MNGARCTLRPWCDDDAEALAALADDPDVARYLTVRFPHPYTLADARRWLAESAHAPDQRNFAIEAGGAPCGGIGLLLERDDLRGSAYLGYWLGRRFWGRGIASDAIRTIAAWAFAELGLRRIYASVLAPNAASGRALVRAGFTFEARLRASLKDRHDVVHDELIYGRLARDPGP